MASIPVVVECEVLCLATLLAIGARASTR